MIGNRAKLGVDVDVDASGVGPGVDKASGKLGKLGGIAKGMGAAVAGGVAVAVGAVGTFAVKSIGAASAVQQSFGALDSVYGKNAERVKKWAAGAATSVGLAKSEYANLSALVGSQLQGMGVAQDASAKRSDKLIRLGADLAATYGGSVNDAVQAVSSTLKGETDPIERYGVSIKQSDINARLAAQGLDGLTGKAAKQAQAQAVLGLLTEQTTKAQGAFSRETNTLAGQQERLGAKFENLKATLGEKLLPVATKVVSWASDKLLPASMRLGRYLSAQLGPTFASVGQFIKGRVIPAAREFHGWFVEKIAPNLAKTVRPVLNGIRSAFSSVSKSVSENKPQLDKLKRAFGDVVEFSHKYLIPLMGKTLGGAFKIAGKAIGGTIDIVSALVDGFSKAKNAVKDFINWVGKIKIPDINIPGFAAHYAHGSPSGSRGAPGYAPRGDGLARASIFDGAEWMWNAAARAGSAAASKPTVIDARVFITVEGDVLDEDALVSKVKKAFERRTTRMGGVAV